MKMQKTADIRSNRYSLSLILSIIAALLSIMVLSLSLSWDIAIMAGLVILAAILLMRDAKQALLAVLITTLPLNFSKTLIHHSIHIGGAQNFDVSLMNIALLGLYLIWLLEKPDGIIEQRRIPSIFTWSLTLFIVISGLSIIKAEHITLSIFELYRIGIAALIFLYFAKRVDIKKEFNLIIIALLFGLFLISAETLTNHFLGTSFNLSTLGRGESNELSEFIAGNNFMRAGGSLGSPNALASYLVLLLPISFALLFSKIKTSAKLADLVVFLAGSATLLLTLSRGAWIGFSLAIITILLLAVRRRLLSSIMVSAFIVLSGGLVVLINFMFDNMIWLRFTASQAHNVTSRLKFALIAFNVIKSNPILGVGINNFSEVMARFDTTGVMSIIGVNNPPVHDIYLLIAAEIGVIGLIVFLTFFIAVMFADIKACFAYEDPYAWVLIGILGEIGRAHV